MFSASYEHRKRLVEKNNNNLVSIVGESQSIGVKNDRVWKKIWYERSYFCTVWKYSGKKNLCLFRENKWFILNGSMCTV